MMVMTVSGCRNDKKTSDTISQQQDFPEREININASDTHKVEVADSIEPQDHVAQAVQAVEQAAHAAMLAYSSRNKHDDACPSKPPTNADEDKADEWRREIGRIPYQPNIAFKMIWEPTQGINEVYNALKRGEFDENCMNKVIDFSELTFD